MEKKRRARINHCLNELKSLILDAMKKDPARHSKLEKADILEMTVKHLQDVQREQMRSAVSADPTVITKFHSGFSECATEVGRYVSGLEGVDDGVKRRLLGHLTGCVSGLSQVLPLATSQPSPEDVNNNSNMTAQRILNGLQLIPSRLPSGELAILLPSMPEHRSAFKAVARSPPPLSPISTDSIGSDHVTSTSPDLPHKSLEAAQQESPASTSTDMWRPW
ncbi:protein deadpan-like isoform X2 [Cimex lectularius]|nr:protein deadpan-like isoform X2 [Cimex lectularius]